MSIPELWTSDGPSPRTRADAPCKGARLGPHNRCGHETPLPRGWRRCAADASCPVRVPDRSEHMLCREHRNDIHAAIHAANTTYRELMGASS